MIRQGELKCWTKRNGNSSVFLSDLFTGVQHLCTFNIVASLIYHRLLNVWTVLYTISTSIFVDVPYWPSYSTDKFISCVVQGPSQWFFHFGKEIIIAWTHIGWVQWMFQNLPLPASQEVRDSSSDVTPCIGMKNDEGSVPPSVVVFSWALDEGGAAGTCSSRQLLPLALEVQLGAILPYQCHTPQWTSSSQHIV